MPGFILAYLSVTGFLANGIKVLRHVGKAAARVCEGEYKEAGSELLTAAVAPVDGVEHLVGLFQGVRLDAVESLLAVPRAPAGSAQPRHQIDQLLELFAGSGQPSG